MFLKVSNNEGKARGHPSLKLPLLCSRMAHLPEPDLGKESWGVKGEKFRNRGNSKIHVSQLGEPSISFFILHSNKLLIRDSDSVPMDGVRNLHLNRHLWQFDVHGLYYWSEQWGGVIGNAW